MYVWMDEWMGGCIRYYQSVVEVIKTSMITNKTLQHC